MTDASTPRPWHVYDDRQFTVYPGIGAAKDSVVIFGLKNEQCGVRGDTLEARKANAALIVRAVNAHDDLVAALRRISDIAQTILMRGDVAYGVGQIIGQCEDALKKAETT